MDNKTYRIDVHTQERKRECKGEIIGYDNACDRAKSLSMGDNVARVSVNLNGVPKAKYVSGQRR